MKLNLENVDDEDGDGREFVGEFGADFNEVFPVLRVRCDILYHNYSVGNINEVEYDEAVAAILESLEVVDRAIAADGFVEVEYCVRVTADAVRIAMRLMRYGYKRSFFEENKDGDIVPVEVWRHKLRKGEQ